MQLISSTAGSVRSGHVFDSTPSPGLALPSRAFFWISYRFPRYEDPWLLAEAHYEKTPDPFSPPFLM